WQGSTSGSSVPAGSGALPPVRSPSTIFPVWCRSTGAKEVLATPRRPPPWKRLPSSLAPRAAVALTTETHHQACTYTTFALPGAARQHADYRALVGRHRRGERARRPPAHRDSREQPTRRAHRVPHASMGRPPREDHGDRNLARHVALQRVDRAAVRRAPAQRP